MSDLEHYGLEAAFQFRIDPKSRTDISWVRSQLGGIETAVESLSSTLGRNNIASQFTTESRDIQRATRRTSSAVDQMGDALKAASKAIDPLKREFRALRAESRNIEFGELTDPEQFKQATREIKQYVTALKSLESQITGNTTAEREFSAVLRQQQSVAQTRIDLAEAERRAAVASQNLGSAQALQGVGQAILGNLSEPIEAAKELQQGLGTVKKLAGDISDRGLVDVKNNILNLSAAMGVADSQISSVFEDLAGAGKSFSDAIDPKTGQKAIESRIAEVNQILKNKSALDITTGAATELNITLGSIYKKSLPQYAGGVVEVNARAASAINDLTDRLEDVRISAEDVIPVMKVVMNTIGDASNFPVDQIAAFSAAVSSLGTIEPEAAGSFFNRFSAAISKNPTAYVEKLGYASMDAFNTAINTDKLGVIVKIAETYKTINGELERGKFLGKEGLGLGSAQDQKLIQGLANNIEVLVKARDVAHKGFYGEVGEDLSVQAEFNRVMQTSAFQAERFEKATEALKHTLGLAIQDALTPLMEALSNTIQFVLTLTQKFPGVTKAIALSAVALGGLATAAGTAGVVLFGLEQAGAVASVAMISMQRSLLPLTGFFSTAQAALAGTNPLETFFRSNTKLAADFGRAATGNFEETTTGLQLLARQAINTGRALLVFSRSLVLSPLGIAVGGFILLNTLVEQVVPGFNMLGIVLGAIAAPFGFIWGVIKGITESLMQFLGLTGSGAMGAIAPLFQTISNAISMAAKSFTLFASSGERLGRALGDAILFPFEFAGRRIVSAWNKTLGVIRNLLRPFAEFVQRIGQMLIGFLAEASPGPTYWIRTKWEMTVQYLQGLFAPLLNLAQSVGSLLSNALSPVSHLFSGRRLDIGVTQSISSIQDSVPQREQGNGGAEGLLHEIAIAGREGVKWLTWIGDNLNIATVDLIPEIQILLQEISPKRDEYARQLVEIAKRFPHQFTFNPKVVESTLKDVGYSGNLQEDQAGDFVNKLVKLKLGNTGSSLSPSDPQVANQITKVLHGIDFSAPDQQNISQLVNAVQNLDVGENRGASLATSFTGSFSAIKSNWLKTGNFISSNIDSLVGKSTQQGQQLQGALSEASPGPTYWIRTKWTMTVQYLQGLFVRLKTGALAVGQQLSNIFTSVLPQLPNAISVATVLAELSGLINPIEGLVLAIGNTIFGGFVESMGKSLDQVIPIFVRRLSLIAAFGGFIAQRLNFIQPLQARIIAGLAILTSLSTLYFKNFSADVTNIWHFTVQAIQGDLQALAGLAKNIGLLLISFLAEASPGPTYWIREKWAMTVQFLQELFRRISAAASLVNQAFLGIGDVSADQQMVARQTIFQGVVLTLVSGVKSLFYVGQALTWVYDNLQRTVSSAIANLDLLSFSLLTVASLPATMIPLLREGFEQVIPELGILAGQGIPRAILLGLPGAIAIATSSGLVKGFERGFAAFVAGVPARSAAFSHAVYSMFDQAGLKDAVNQGLSEGVTAFVRSLPAQLGGRADFTFKFDFDKAYAAYEEQRNARVAALVSYLKQVGNVANQVGAQLQAALAPILSFQIQGIAVIPFFSVILPFRDALVSLASSPAVLGFIGFLSGTVLPTVARTLAAIATTVTFIFNTFVTLPVAAAINVLTREAVAATRAIIQAGIAFVTTIPAILAQGVVILAKTTVQTIASVLARIPYIGQFLSQAFLSSIDFLVATSQTYFQLLTRSFQRFTTQIWSLLGPTYQRLAQQVFQGIVYAFEQGVKPVATIVGRLIAGAFDPRTAFRFLTFYFRTGGFRQVFKPGLLAINPIDLLFGGMGPLSQALTAGFKLALGVAFPANIISSKQAEAFQILADPLSKAKASRFKLMVKMVDIMESLPPALRPVLEIFKGLMLVSPIVQIIGRLAIASMFWYSVLKPLNPEIYEAIRNTKVLGVSLSPLADILRAMRFVFVDMGEAFFKFAQFIPPFVRATQQLFNLLGTSTGVIVHEVVGVTSILLNVFKATFGNLFLVVSIGFAEALKLTLVNMQWWASFLRLKTQQYGDAIVAALHGHLGPLIHQVFSDIAQGVTILFQRTIGLAARAISSLAIKAVHIVGATFQEIGRLIRDPIGESIRLIGLFQDAVNRTFGGIATTINNYIQQLQLDRLVRFLGHFWIQLAAIADVLLLVTGILNPLQFIITALIGLGIFLVNEYRTGFQTLDAIIAGLAHPIEFVTNAINAMIGALGVYIPPELTEFIAGVTEQFVKSLPIITGGVFLLALLIRRNIGQAFQDVVGGVMKIVSGVMQAVEATRIFGGVVRETASSAQVQTEVGARVHQVRRRETFLGIRNPFAYSQNDTQQQRAVALGDERVAKSRAALRYQDEMNKSLAKITKEEEDEVKRLARSRNARDQIMAFGGRLQREDGFSYDVAPLLERKKGLFGLEKLELSETGRAKVAQQARRRLYQSDSDDAQQARMKAAGTSGLAAAFTQYGGTLPPDEVLKRLGQQGDYGVTSLLNAFQKAMENLHVGEFQANKLYVAEFVRPKNLSATQPVNPRAFDLQLNDFLSKIKNPADLAILQAATPTQKIDQRIGDVVTKNNPVTAGTDYKKIFNDVYIDLFKQINPGSTPKFESIASQKATELVQAALQGGEQFKKTRQRILNEMMQVQVAMLNDEISDFNKFEASNIAALKEAQRDVEGFHPIATNTDVLTQAIRNIAGQTQADVEQANKTRRSLFSAVFGFTGVPQLIENFQYNQRLFRRTQRISRIVEQMAVGESRERTIAEEARRRGLAALMSNAGYKFPQESVQFYALKKINAQEQAFIDSWINNKNFKVDITQHEAFKSEADKILANFNKLSTQLTFRTLDDVKRFQELLTQHVPKAEQENLKKLQQFILHGAAQKPTGSQVSYTERDKILGAINQTLFASENQKLFSGFGFTGDQNNKITAASLKNLRDEYDAVVNQLTSRFMENGQLIAEIGGKNEYIQGAYKELEEKLGLGKGGTSLRKIQNVKLKNTIRQIGVNLELFEQDIRLRVTEFRDGVSNALDGFETWLASRSPFPSLAPRIVNLIRDPFNALSNNIGTLYNAQKASLGKVAEQIRADFIGSNLISRINRLNKQYRDARDASLQTILEASKDKRVAKLASQGHTTTQLRNVREKLTKQQFTQVQSGQAMTALMRGAMSQEAVRAMLGQELRRQGLSKQQVSTEIDKVLSQFGTQARYSVGDILKMRGLDASKVSKALESALSLEAAQVEKILKNPNYTARAVAPFQLFLVRELPGLMKDTAKGFVGTINKFGGGAIARAAGIVAKDIAIGFKGEFLDTLAASTRTLSERLGVGANQLALSMERVAGKNPFSDAVRGFSDFLRARGKATADFLKAQALAPDDTRSLTKVIKNRTIELFKAIGSAIQSAQAAIQAQGGGVFGAIRALFGGLKGFFGKLFNRQQNPQLAQLDTQIQQQRDRAARARERQKKAQSLVDNRVDPWVRDAGRNAAQRQYDVAREADAKAAQLQRQRDLTATFLQPRYSGAGSDVAKSFGAAIGKVGKIYENAATKLGQRVTELRGRYTAVRAQEISSPTGQAHQYQPKPGGGFFTRNIKQQGGITSYDEYIQSLSTKIFTKLTESGHSATLKLSNYFKGSALRSQTAWEESANHITGNSWWAMTKRAVWTGVKIVTNLNHGAADKTAAAWQRSEQSVSQDMHQMAETAQQTGQQISQSMEQSAKRSGGFFSHLGNSIGKVGKAGMAIGAGVAATGFGLQTAAYSLSTLGFISEESSQELNKFFEIFTLLGAVGGILTPILTAVFSSLGAIGSIALTAASGIAAVGGAIAPLIGLGGVAFAPFLVGIAAVAAAFGGLYLAVRTNLLGIGTIVHGIGTLLGNILAGPISFIESAWQGFVDRFGSKLMPIIQPALDIAQGLINALNHNPTEKIPAAWDIAGERIKGVLGSILGAGQAVGNGLVSFFTPIVSLFNPIARLFGKKDKEQSKTPYPELTKTPEKSEDTEKGIFGSIMGAITNLVMLPVNLIKGLADWIAGVIAGVIKGVITAITGPLQWVADALRPLQMPIAMIELFFKNLVSIVQSVVYLNAVMRPLAENAISINATINEIAKFFYSLRSLVESAEFLYYHVFNRKALAQGAGQGGSAVDPSRLPSNYRGSGGPKNYTTEGKAIQDLSLGEAVGEVTGVFKNVMSIKNNVGAVFGGFRTGLNWLGGAWSGTMQMIKGETGTLVADSEVQGYNLQKNLSEGSPGPTYWIRQNWDKTTKALQGWMGDLSGKSKETGQDIAANLTPDPVTPTPTIAPVLDSPRQATGFTALKTGAIAAIDSITQEVKTKYQMLERGGIGNFGALFLPGLGQTIKSVGILTGDIGDFAKRSVVALATLNFGELSDAVRDFGGNFAYAASGVLSGFKQMGGGAIAFGLYAITSISPFLVILGGVAFVAAVIVANFLGLRTILGGAFRIGIGLGQILIAVIGGVINVGRSLGMILGGVFLAMRGDFSLLDQGIAQFKASFQGMGRGIATGLNTIKTGFFQILRGIKEGITQILPMLPEWMEQLKAVAIAFRDPERAGEMVAEVLIGAFNRVKDAIKAIPTLLGRIPGLILDTVNSILPRINQAVDKVWEKAKEVYNFFRTLTFAGIVERLVTEFRDIPRILAQLPGQILARIEQAIPALKAPFDYLRGFVRGFVRRIAAELPPDFVQAVSTALSAGATKIRTIFTNLSGDIVTIIRQIAAKLGVEEQFARILRKVSDRWNQFVELVKQGKLFAWVPRTAQEFSDFFVGAVSQIEAAWNAFTQWLKNTPFFSSLFTQIEQLSQRFAMGMEWLEGKWASLQEKLAVPNLFAAFFDRLRGVGDAFSNAIIWLEEKWRNFATQFNLPLFQGVFDNLWALGERFNQLVTFIENRWNQLATFLSTTPIVGWAITGIKWLGQVFTNTIQFIQKQWTPFVEFLSSGTIFSSIFDGLRGLGQAIPNLKTTIKESLQDIPSTAQKVFDKLIEIATGAVNKIKGLFGNIFGTQKLGAIDEQINLKKENIGRAKTNLNNAFDAFGRSQANIGISQAQAELDALLQQRAELTSNPLIGAVDRIQQRWQEFSLAFKPILEPITKFASWVAEKLIQLLNCSPTVKIPTAWDNAVDNIIATIQLLIEPFRRVGNFIVNTFGFVFDFIKALFQSFYGVITPVIERVLTAINNIKKGAVAADEIGSLFQGTTIYLQQLKDAVKPITDLIGKLVARLRETTAESQEVVSVGQSLGRAFGRLTLGVIDFTVRAIPPLIKGLSIIIRFAIEIVAFVAKVAYALRFLVSYFTRVGFAAFDTIMAIVRFAKSAGAVTERIQGAFAQLQADIEKFVVNVGAGLRDLGRALRRLVGAFLDVFAPQLKPVLKEAIAEFESFVSLIRFALVDLISTTVERIQQFYEAVRGMSPFQFVEQGVEQVKGAIATFGQVLQQVADATGFTQALAPIAQLLEPIAQWLGITSKSAQEMKQAFQESGAAVSSTLAGLGSQVQDFFVGLTTRAKDAIEPFVIYYRAALDDLVDRIRASFPFQVLESGFRQLQEVSSIALSAIYAGIERVGGIFRQVLVTLHLDVPFDAGVAAVQNFGNEVATVIEGTRGIVRRGVEQMADWVRQQFVILGERITDVIAQIVAQIYVKLTAVGDGFRAIAEQAISQMGTAFESLKAFIAQALQPYAPIIEALGEVFAAIRRIGGAIAELMGDFSIFGLNVGGILGEIILNFGKATWAVIDFAGKVLTPIGLIGIATAIFNIAGAIKDLIVNFGILVGEAIPALGRLGTAIKESLEAPLNAIAFLWTNTIGKIQSAITGLTSKSQVEGEQVAQAVGETPARKSWQFWKRTTEAVQADVKAMTEELQAQSHDIQAAVSEGSPGPTFWIRQHWQKTVDFVRERMQELGQVAKAEGEQINENLNLATGGINASGIRSLEGNIEGISERNQKLAHTAQSLFTTLGSALSNFAPQLAMPLFMVNDFINAFFDIKKAIPEVQALIRGTEAVTVASNAAVAVSEAAVTEAAGTSSMALIAGAETAGAAKSAEAATVGGANAWMAATYGFLANAARSAYTSMIAPLIPFLPMILAVSAGLFLLYQAFHTNFSGIGDAIGGVVNAIRDFFGLLFSEAWRTVASIFLTIEYQIRAIARTVRRVGNILMEPFRPLFAAFGISGGRGILGNAMVATINLILLPLKLVAGAINFIINLLGGFIQGVILIGGVILNFILLPIRLINAAIYGVMMGFNSIMLGINSAINHFLVLPLWIADFVARQIGGAIAAVGRGITNFILRPFFAIENVIMSAIAPVVNFVLRAFGFIAGAAALIFAILNPGVVIGAFIAFVTGATFAAKAIQFVLGLPIKAIEFLWRNTVGKIFGVTQGFVESAKGFGEQLKIFLSDPTVAIRESWQATIEFIQSKLAELGIVAKEKGQEVTQSILPALPGAAPPPNAFTQTPLPPPLTPAPLDAHFQTLGLAQAPTSMSELKQAYRTAAKTAHPDAGGTTEQFHAVQNAYDRIKGSMEAPPRNSVTDELEATTKQVGTLSTRMRGFGASFSNTLGSIGAAIANFSPQLAAPFFMLNDFINALLSMEGLLPAIQAFFAGKKVATVADAATTAAANGAIAESNLLVAASSEVTALAVIADAEGSAAAVAAEATVVGTANTWMATTFGILGEAAMTAYAMLVEPLIPFLPVIAAVVVAVGLLYLAFKTNFLGIGDLITGFAGGFIGVFGVIWGVIKGVGGAIAQVIGTLVGSFGDIFNALKELASAILLPFVPLLGLFGGGGTGGGSLGDAIAATVKLILVPVEFIANSLSLVIRGITFLVVGVIKLATAIVTTVLKPIADALSFLNPVLGLFRMIVGAIGGVTVGIITLIGLIGFIATTAIPFVIGAATSLFGIVSAGFTFIFTSAIPLVINGLMTIATVVLPLLIDGIGWIATTAIPFLIEGFAMLIPMVVSGFTFLASTAIPAVIAGLQFIALSVLPLLIEGILFLVTVAIPAIVAGLGAIAAAAIPLLIEFSPIILVVLAIVAAVWLIKAAFDAVVWVVQSVVQWIGNAINSIGQFFQNLPLIGRLFGGGSPRDTNSANNIQQFAGGGLVKGSGTDGIPVIAHAGEFVVTPEATRANLGVLEYLNAGGQLALPTPGVGIMPPMPLALPTPVAVPAEGAGSGTVVIENVNLNFEVQINASNGAEAGDEFLRYIEDPRFKRSVRQALREMVERTK